VICSCDDGVRHSTLPLKLPVEKRRPDGRAELGSEGAEALALVIARALEGDAAMYKLGAAWRGALVGVVDHDVCYLLDLVCIKACLLLNLLSQQLGSDGACQLLDCAWRIFGCERTLFAPEGLAGLIRRRHVDMQVAWTYRHVK